MYFMSLPEFLFIKQKNYSNVNSYSVFSSVYFFPVKLFVSAKIKQKDRGTEKNAVGSWIFVH